MEENNTEKSLENFDKLTQDNIPRCPNCNLICSLKLLYDKGQSNINFQCENGHEGFMPLKEYLTKYNKYALSKEKCKECGKIKKKKKGDFFYCSKCSKFLCSSCQVNHFNNENHNMININRYDALCKIHSNLYTWYCVDCQKNLCAYCKSEHKNHNLIDLSDFTFTQELKNKLENDKVDLGFKLKNLECLKNDIVAIFNNLKESSKFEMEYINILLWTYKYEEKHNNLNYNVIQNLRDYEMVNSIKNDFFEKVYEEGNKFISLIENMEIDEKNYFQNQNYYSYKNENVKRTNLKNSSQFIPNNQKEILRATNIFSSNLQNTNILNNNNLQNSFYPNNNNQNIDFQNNYQSNIYQNNELQNNNLINIKNNNLNDSAPKPTQQTIETLQPFKILKTHKAIINYIDILKDGRLVSCSDDCTLKIYKLETFEVQLSIKEHSDYVRSFTELQNGKIITCSKDKTMKVIKLRDNNYEVEQTLKDHLDSVYKVIEIRKNELISVSWDKTMKIWEINNEKRFECVNTITFQKLHSNCNILKLNEEEFVTSSCQDENLKFWNSEDYTRIKTLNNIETAWTLKNLCLIDNDILCVGGRNSKGYYMIKISSHKIIKYVVGVKTVFSINKCLDGLFLCSIEDENDNNCLVKYTFIGQKFRIIINKESAHESEIYSSVELKDGVVVSAGKDGLIKFWNFNIE